MKEESTPAVTMYQRLQLLPLLKGLSSDQLSTVMEKTPLDFRTYAPGDVIIDYDEPVEGVTFLLTGRVEVAHRAPEMEIVEVWPELSVVNADRLYGYHRTSAVRVRAIDAAGVLFIRKERFEAMLESQPILKINYLNYLSVRAQRVADFLPYGMPLTDLKLRLQMMKLIGNREALETKIVTTPRIAAEIVGPDPSRSPFETANLSGGQVEIRRNLNFSDD